jgi:uncharacterized protein
MTNQICHFEIGCRDRGRTAEFYSQMFEWSIRADPNAAHIQTGGEVGGHISALGHEPHNYTIFYVMVDDVSEALARAVSLGGKKLVGPVPLPNETTFGWFADPEGNTVGVYSEKSNRS